MPLHVSVCSVSSQERHEKRYIYTGDWTGYLLSSYEAHYKYIALIVNADVVSADTKSTV